MGDFLRFCFTYHISYCDVSFQLSICGKRNIWLRKVAKPEENMWIDKSVFYKYTKYRLHLNTHCHLKRCRNFCYLNSRSL